MQRLFARVAWRMRGGWSMDVPFVEKLPSVSPTCVSLLEDAGQGAGGSLIESHDGWGGCENVEPDMECVAHIPKKPKSTLFLQPVISFGV